MSTAPPTETKQQAIDALVRHRSTSLDGVSETPDKNTQEETQLWEDEQKIAEKRLDLRIKEQDLRFRQKEHEERIKYAQKMYTLVCMWLGAIAVLIVVCGFVFLDGVFALSDKVLITILTTTTVTVVGLFATVLRYLFVSNPPSPT